MSALWLGIGISREAAFLLTKINKHGYNKFVNF